MKMQTLRRLVSALVLGGAASGAWAAIDVSGVPLEDTVTVGGQQLHLNGAGDFLLEGRIMKEFGAQTRPKGFTAFLTLSKPF